MFSEIYYKYLSDLFQLDILLQKVKLTDRIKGLTVPLISRAKDAEQQLSQDL